MPAANLAASAIKKYWLLDHDADVVNEAPPVLNQWYTVFNADDVLLKWCCIYQKNDEQAAKNLEIRWTIDGNVYFATVTAAHNTKYWIYRSEDNSNAGTAGLVSSVNQYNACCFTGKSGHAFTVEVRIVSALGTNQELHATTVRETSEVT